MSEPMSERMKDAAVGNKPRVFKLTPGGMWWADVRSADGTYLCACFFTYTKALERAREYAAMNRAAK